MNVTTPAAPKARKLATKTFQEQSLVLASVSLLGIPASPNMQELSSLKLTSGLKLANSPFSLHNQDNCKNIL
jgi:hypothetical protein